MAQRTSQQNKSLHLLCRMYADELNAAGYDAQTVITLPISLTEEIVKENIFKVIMRALYPEYVSTTQLSTVEMQNVYEHVNAALAHRFGVSVPWPDEYTLEMDQKLKDRGMRRE